MAAVALIATVVGAGISAYGQIQAGQSAEAAAQYNAEIAQQQAAMQSQQAKGQAFNLSVQKRQTIGQQAAMAAASGVDINSGSPLDLMANTADQYERDIQTAGISADYATIEGSEEANLDLMSGRQSMLAGWLGGASTLATGVGSGIMNYNRSTNLGI